MTARRTGFYVLAAAVLFPLVPWLMAGSVEDRFTGIATLKSVANFAPSLREWLPDDHLAWFVIDAIAEMDLEPLNAAHRRGGGAAPPSTHR